MRGCRTLVSSLLIAALLISGCFFSGCTTQGPTNSRIKVVTPGPGDENIQDPHASLEEAIGMLRSDDGGRMNRAGNYSIHYIHGEGIDPSGLAAQWVLAVKTNTTQFYFEFKEHRFSEYNWTERQIDPPVPIDTILMPSDLFSVHRAFIQDTLKEPDITRTELELRNGQYTLTVTRNSTPTEYVFNANTGGLIKIRNL
jgi:hypothetical protein